MDIINVIGIVLLVNIARLVIGLQFNIVKGNTFSDDRDIPAGHIAGCQTKIKFFLQWNASFGVMLDQVHFSCRKVC